MGWPEVFKGGQASAFLAAEFDAVKPEWILVLLLPPFTGLVAAALGWAVCWREAARGDRDGPAMAESDKTG